MTYKKLKFWFDGDLARSLANKIATVDPEFDTRDFISKIELSIPNLELKDRIAVFADEFYLQFQGDFKNGLSTLLQILGPENEKETGMFTEYYWIMPIATFIEKYGLANFALSMRAIEEVTKRSTGEYAIRPYIVSHFEKTMAQMTTWSKSPNSHVRRLSCEGLRPRLPWARKLDIFIRDPGPILPILEQLKDDRSKYVQNSVANCINDILKDNFSTGKDLISRWHTGEVSKERKWIIRHALRNLRKANNTWAMEVSSPQ